MSETRAYAAQSETSGLAPWTIERRALRPDDVQIEVLFCGVCHTDIHFVENDWDRSNYPLVPGHEIVGRVSAVGAEVTGVEVGQIVGVGCMVDSCRSCAACERGWEQYCAEGMTPTYNGEDRHGGGRTYGGYSERVVVSERFVLKVPEALDPAAAAPLLCAGITSWSPLKRSGVGEGTRVGVVGMGGLGHMGIKLAVALGAEVTVFTRSARKVEEAHRNGAHRVVISADAAAMEAAMESLDFILDTVPVDHDLNPYLHCLAVNGAYVLVGQITPITTPVEASALIYRQRTLSGSLIGGVSETQALLDFCAEKGVACDVEMLNIKDIAEAYERVKRGDVRYRFVIDVSTLRG